MSELPATPPTPDVPHPPSATSAVGKVPVSPGFWAETWKRFKKNRLAMVSLWFVGFLAAVALLAPAIAATKPIVCSFKGKIYFPSLSYYNMRWQPVLPINDDRPPRFVRRGEWSKLGEVDPNFWAIWPLFYQDPYRRVQGDEIQSHPGSERGTPPDRVNWFGTDNYGKDVLAQMVHGTMIALSVGLISMGIAAILGIVVGAIAGYAGGWIDILLSRLIEVVLCVPPLILILALLALLERPTIYHMMLVLGLTRWTDIARLTRGEFLRLREMDFVAAARVLGIPKWRIVLRHILPNALAPVLVPITFGIADAIFVEAGLSFLGFGAPPPNPSWGTLLQQGRETTYAYWWLIVFPGLAIFFTVLAYNLIGEGLQDATDPRLRQR